MIKTLKDIYEDAPTPHHGLEAYNRLLRQEAIKRIKFLDKQYIMSVTEPQYYEGNQVKIKLIKEFFNIGEEDLK